MDGSGGFGHALMAPVVVAVLGPGLVAMHVGGIDRPEPGLRSALQRGGRVKGGGGLMRLARGCLAKRAELIGG